MQEINGASPGRSRFLTDNRLAAVALLMLFPLICLLVVEVRRSMDYPESSIRRYHEISRSIQEDPTNSHAYEELVATLRSPDPWERTQLFAQMASLGRILIRHQESQAIFERYWLPAIQQGLQDTHGTVRREAAISAKNFGIWAKRCVPELINVVVQYQDEDSSCFAATALGNIGPDAANALPVLRRIAIEGSAWQEEVELAIRKIEVVSKEPCQELPQHQRPQ